jgi:pectinesterase
MKLTSGHQKTAVIAAPATISAMAAMASHAAPADRIMVAADGSGHYQSVEAAIDAVPTSRPAQMTIGIEPGAYRGVVNIPSSKPDVRLFGLGQSPSDVVIVENHSAGTLKLDGTTYGTSGKRHRRDQRTRLRCPEPHHLQRRSMDRHVGKHLAGGAFRGISESRLRGQSQWGQMFTMSFVSMAPVIGFFIAGQKYLVKGIATTGLK